MQSQDKPKVVGNLTISIDQGRVKTNEFSIQFMRREMATQQTQINGPKESLLCQARGQDEAKLFDNITLCSSQH